MSKESPAVKKAKRSSSIGANDTSEFDSETQKALEEIDACQSDIDALNEKASEEILKVEQKYNKLRRPFLEKRGAVISNIPGFWVNVFINHPQLTSVLCEEDEDCLQYLNKIDVEEYEDIKSGYKIRLQFRENPFFSNEELVKEFHLAPTGEPTSIATAIKWKNGQNLVQKFSELRKAKGSKRPNLPDRTFFEWFLDNSEPSCDELAEAIKDDIWPNPLQYFLAAEGNGLEGEDDGLSDEDENGEGGEDEEEEYLGEEGDGDEDDQDPEEEDEEDDA